MDLDVAIIGAGLSGLAAGIRLAHFGKRVCIFERHSVTGGLSSYYRRGEWELDVGLHAMTNFVSPDVKSAPLNRLLRQLRLRHDDLGLCPQEGSRVRFPGCELRFTNDPRDLEAEVAATFPSQIDGYRRLVLAVEALDAYSLATVPFRSAREELARHLTDPLLTDMLLCPLMYYGNATARDMDFGQFCVMFRSIYLEGLSRPRGGVGPLLSRLEARYREGGGELRLRCGVRHLQVDQGRVRLVELSDGTAVRAASVLSCAGLPETLRLCEPALPAAAAHPPGWFSAVELTVGLDAPPGDLGRLDAILFYSRTPTFRFERPEGSVDPTSGVLCVPACFHLPAAAQANRLVRLTRMANGTYWTGLPAAEYRERKRLLLEEQIGELERLIPGIRPRIQFADVFTPRSIATYTGHLDGAIYGSPVKARDGRTPVDNLFVCGTDQGFLGITGALLSGASIANAYLLR